MSELLDKARDLIRAELARAERPAVLWSAGKDSQLLLWLVREIEPRIPVLHFTAFSPSSKHRFALRMVSEMDLTLYPALPAFRDVVARGDHVEVVEAYGVRDFHLYFPIEAEPGYEPDKDCFCAIEKLNQPTSREPMNFDVLFIGHKSRDEDPAHGALPLADYTVEAGGVRAVYPLRDFTDTDVWQESGMVGVEQNYRRYAGKDMSQNADYWPLCTRCLDPGRKEMMVFCPKAQDEVYSLGPLLNLEGRCDGWRQTFVNIER